jgi:hypothetical protein
VIAAFAVQTPSPLSAMTVRDRVGDLNGKGRRQTAAMQAVETCGSQIMGQLGGLADPGNQQDFGRGCPDSGNQGLFQGFENAESCRSPGTRRYRIWP